MEHEALNYSSPNGISVLVAGSGVGGLIAALECARRGFSVRVLERTKHLVTTGDSFTIGITAINAFRNWPKLEQANEDIVYDPLVAFCDISGKRYQGPMEFNDIAPDNTRLYRHSRPKFHVMLVEQLERIGVSVEYDCHVVEYFDAADANKAGVVLKDGSRHEADLVIAADGVRGSSWSLLHKEPIPARSSGSGLFRVAYPVELALADSLVTEKFPLHDDGRSVMETWSGDGVNAIFWRAEDNMTFVMSHPDWGTAEESWAHTVDSEEILKYTATIEDWPEAANRVIMAAPKNSIVDWKVMWRDPQPNWTSHSGRVVQLGDCAHTFLPSSGNGATQAIEDGISLATCLSLAGDKEHIPDATCVHNLLRFERVSCFQAFGVKNRKAFRTKPSENGGRVPVHVGKWMVQHDPEHYALDHYAEALAHLKHGTPFQNTNIPPGLVYKPWTIDGLMDAMERGEPTVFDGDWE